MKKLLALFIAFIMIIPAGTGFVHAADSMGNIVYREDFNDYEGGNVPSGWTMNAGAGNEIVLSAQDAGYGHDTAFKVKSSGTAVTYFNGKSETLDATEGIVKLSFQLYFEGLGKTSGKTQQVLVACGNGSGTPVSRGIRISNGVISYAYHATSAWNFRNTTSSVMPGEWYTFEIISDYGKDKTYFYMNGEPLVDSTTNEPIDVDCLSVKNLTSISSVLFGTRTNHTEANDGADVMIDNITLTNTTASGVYSPAGSDLAENPGELDISFNNTVATGDFNKDLVTVNAYKADDYMLTEGTSVSCSVEELSALSCKVVLNETPDLGDYDKLVVDFGDNRDSLGGKLGCTHFVKLPEAADDLTTVLYDSESDDSQSVQIAASNFDVSDYSYTDGEETKTATLYETNGTSTADIKFETVDGSNLIESGNVYDISLKMKILATTDWDTMINHEFKLSGQFDGTDAYDAGCARLMYFSNLYNNGIAYYEEGKEKPTKFAYAYIYNKDKAEDVVNSTDALFANIQWLQLNLRYYPDTKTYDVSFKRDDGNGDSKSNLGVQYSDTVLKNLYTYGDVIREDMDGSLKNLRFTTVSRKRKIMFDEIMITKTEIPDTLAAVKAVVLKDENGSVISASGAYVDAGIKTIELHLDGTVEEDYIYGISLEGSNAPAYTTSYDNVSKVYTITADSNLVMGGSADYSISIPEELKIDGGITSIDFTTDFGLVDVSAPFIKASGTQASAIVDYRNSSIDISEPASIIIASYKDGAMVAAKAMELYTDAGSYGSLTTEAVSTEGADTVKAFAVSNSNLYHLAPAAELSLAEPATDAEYAFSYSGSAEGEYVTAVLLNPLSDNNAESYTLDSLYDADSFCFIDTLAVDNGKWTLGFDITGKSGRYELCVFDSDGTSLLNKVIYYATDEDRLSAQTLLREAVKNSDTSAEVLGVLNTNGVQLGLYSIDLYEDADKEYIADMLYASVKADDIDLTNRDDSMKRVGDICLIEALNDSKIDDIAPYTDTAAVFENENIGTWYSKNIADSKKITKRLLNKSIADAGDLADKLMEAIALEIIDAGKGYGYVQSLCELLEDEIGIDSSKGTADAYRKLDGKAYDDYAALKADFNSKTAGGSTPSSSPSKNKAPSVGNVTVNAPVTEAPQPIREYVFDDIADYEWAVDSITDLYKKNIVSGRTADTFAPGDRVLREEFVKMIVGAFAIDGTTDTEFEDVSDTDWFKPYIVKAFGAGIINGEGSTFGAGKPITRQDMAKIIYGALVKSGVQLKGADISGLSDYNDIAAYALEGVAALYNAGVINGRGNNDFAPTDYATRAETAVIISRAMALIK